jgi:hypothetical protein
VIHRNGTAVNVLVDFSTGFPDGNIAWSLYDETGVEIDNGTITPAPLSVSAFIITPSSENTLAVGELVGYRDLVWSYSTNGQIINGDKRYVLEALPPYGATPEGVRNKLGVDIHEVPDEEISMARAYYNLLTLAGDPDLSSFTPTSRQRLTLSDGIEALAALALIPTLQIRLALKESSGTDTYQRQAMDWDLLASDLRSMVTDAIVIWVPTFDPLASAGAIFILATPATDPLTGDTA